MYTHSKQIITAGTPVGQAGKAIVMLHGRGASAENIISLGNYLDIEDAAIFAPQATGNSWYPYSFMAPDASNQPALNSALEVIGDLVKEVEAQGITADQIYFLGFSQGACLTLEYITRNAKRYGGAVAFTGGLIGEQINVANYSGGFAGTPVLITTGDPDPHVPLSRVEESVAILKGMQAELTLSVYPGRPHTITTEELELAKQLIAGN